MKETNKERSSIMKNLLYINNAIVEVTKELTFDSAHFLKMYSGKCSKLHGHTFKVHVTVRGKIDPLTGMLIDFKDLKEVIKESALDDLDHAFLNEKFEWNTTSEYLVVYIYDKVQEFIELLPKSKGVSVSSVKLWETPTSFAEYRGETL